jgi:predicted MFS family arabinose efflux permease
VLGGTLTQFASWRWTLLINVPIALVAAFAVTRVIKESKGDSRSGYDIPGALAVTGGFFLLVYGFTNAASYGWGAASTVVMLAGAAVLLIAFVGIELRSSHPLLPMRVILDRNRGGAYLASLLVGSAMLGTFLFLTYFFQGTVHYSAVRTGFAFLPFSGGIVVGAGVASRLLPRVGPRLLMVVGLLTGAVGLLWFTRLGVDSSYLAHVLPPEVLVSFGMGLSFVPMSSTALIGVDPKDAGVASALVNTTQQVGSSLGTALLNTIAASAAAAFLASRSHTAETARAAVVHGYTTAFTVSAVLLLLAAAASLGLIRATRRDVQTGGETEGELVGAAAAGS